jgi:hypothetical protein
VESERSFLESKVGGVLKFRFGGFDMKVLELDPAKHVRSCALVGSGGAAQYGSLLSSQRRPGRGDSFPQPRTF